MIYHIAYDLNVPGKNYSELIETIKKLGDWCRPLKSSWFVDSTFTVEQITATLRRVMDESDFLIVTAVNNPSAWYLPQDTGAWLDAKMSSVPELIAPW